MKPIIEKLNWRYATKQFDPTKKVSNEDFDAIIEAARLAPSSFGLQPWKFIIVNDKKMREELKKHAWGQSQVTDASHFIVFATQETMTPADVERYVQDIANQRKADIKTLDSYKQMMLGSIEGKTKDYLFNWNARQTYLALGQATAVAASLEIDTCPMEGFDPVKFDEHLGLAKKGLRSLACLAVGYRSKDDKAAHMKKVRYPRKHVVIEI